MSEPAGAEPAGVDPTGESVGGNDGVEAPEAGERLPLVRAVERPGQVAGLEEVTVGWEGGPAPTESVGSGAEAEQGAGLGEGDL